MVFGEGTEGEEEIRPLVVSRENCKDFLEMCGKYRIPGKKYLLSRKQKAENVWTGGIFLHFGGCCVQERMESWIFKH